MVRTSSPYWYSRTWLNSMPRPLNDEWYSPLNISLTSRRDRISSLRTFAASSPGSGTPDAPLSARSSGHLDMFENISDEVLGLHVFSLRFVARPDAVAQDVVDDALDILRRGVGAALQEGVGF